jgi:hypothetical protein
MWCAECGARMVRRKDGAWHGCCSRLGYWTDQQPLAMDRWYPVTTIKGKTFYPTANWPIGHKPVHPYG